MGVFGWLKASRLACFFSHRITVHVLPEQYFSLTTISRNSIFQSCRTGPIPGILCRSTGFLSGPVPGAAPHIGPIEPSARAEYIIDKTRAKLAGWQGRLLNAVDAS